MANLDFNLKTPKCKKLPKTSQGLFFVYNVKGIIFLLITTKMSEVSVL